MPKDIQWFYDHIGQTVLRNGTDFYIKNQRYAEYAWELQANGFEYGFRPTNS